jgi:hypothetical protein
MEFKYTRHQVPRGSRPDAETIDKVYLVKNLSLLRATYQVRMLAFRAMESHKLLVLKVPGTCKFDRTLKDLIKATGKTIKREDL